jgi:hypothetical protein
MSKEELNMCLVEQGFDWYKGETNLIALAMLGLIEMHKEDIERIIKEDLK